MKVIKNINNNVCVCIDDDGNELIAFGKGLGFKQPPYEIKDLNMINRTFYDVDQRYFDLLKLIPDDVFELSAKVVDYARNKIETTLSPNIVFTLADHIQFAIQRYKEGMTINLPTYQDLKYFHPVEVKVGEFALKLINQQEGISLEKDEMYSIAMHFVNAESVQPITKQQYSSEKIIADVVNIIESDFNIEIRHDNFNYSRFASHMEYLLERGDKGETVMSQNLTMFKSMKKEFPKTFECAEKIQQYIYKQLGWELSDEEKLYLVLHINRLCSREDYSQ